MTGFPRADCLARKTFTLPGNESTRPCTVYPGVSKFSKLAQVAATVEQKVKERTLAANRATALGLDPTLSARP